MHGLIHIILKEFIVTNFGDEHWHRILAKLNVEDDAAILQLQQYPDEVTVAGVSAAADVVGVSIGDALRAYGAFFVEYVHMGDHLRLLKSMGDDLHTFLYNINNLHHTLERSFTTANFPAFSITNFEDRRGKTDGSAFKFVLSYSSARGALLAPLVEGILPALAKVLHNQCAEMQPRDTLRGFDTSWAVMVTDIPADELPIAGKQICRGGALWHAALMSCCSTNGLQKNQVRPKDTSETKSSESVVTDPPPMTRTTTIKELMSKSIALPTRVRDELDVILADVKSKGAHALADELMRCVKVSSVGADWADTDHLAECEVFWGSNEGRPQDWLMSQHCKTAARFVSHSWMPPTNWTSVMGQNCSYYDLKSTELIQTAEELSSSEDKGQPMTLWVDKCCIPQGHALMSTCVSLIEEFIRRCEGLVVLLSWQYFERLWCVYEWASFLMIHDPLDVTICVESFLRPDNQSLYLQSVRAISLAQCKCNHEPDRVVLHQKVDQYYVSHAKFETYAKVTAVALIALSMSKKAGRSSTFYETDVVPWLNLAEELGFADLAAALRSADPVYWRHQAIQESSVTEDGNDRLILGKAARPWRKLYVAKLSEWFSTTVCPILMSYKQSAVRPEYL